jgi:hypothetical protein
MTPPSAPFDGTWVVNETCTSKPPFFPAATLHYALQVTDGRLHTSFGEQGKPGSTTFDGKIGKDGSAKISVNGYTDPAKDPLHRAAGTPFHYALALQFKQSSGTGVRTETPRPCRMELSRPSSSDPSKADATEIPAAKPPDEAPPPAQINIGKDASPGDHDVERHPGKGLACSTMRAKCAAVCVAKTGRRDCASTICVRLEEICVSTGCWKGRGFSGCGLARR